MSTYKITKIVAGPAVYVAGGFGLMFGEIEQIDFAQTTMTPGMRAANMSTVIRNDYTQLGTGVEPIPNRVNITVLERNASIAAPQPHAEPVAANFANHLFVVQVEGE